MNDCSSQVVPCSCECAAHIASLMQCMYVCMYACIDPQRSSSKKQLQLQLSQLPTIDHSKNNCDAIVSSHYACNYMAAFKR